MRRTFTGECRRIQQAVCLTQTPHDSPRVLGGGARVAIERTSCIALLVGCGGGSEALLSVAGRTAHVPGSAPFEVHLPLHAQMDGRDLPIADAFAAVWPSLDPVVASLLDRALGHEPGARPTAKELADALSRASAIATSAPAV